MKVFMQKLATTAGTEVLWLLAVFGVVTIGFGLTAPNFFSVANIESIATQMPILGILTLAMMIPIVSGGFNLAIVYSANLSGLALAWVLMSFGGAEAGIGAFLLGIALAVFVGAAAGWLMGFVIARIGAHPILVSLAMMIFLRGVGEFLTRGADISGFPPFLRAIGYGSILSIPIPMIIFGVAASAWAILLGHTRHGIAARMVGSNLRAAEYAGLNAKRNLMLVYTLSGTMSAVAGILMLTQFNSVRVGHGEALLLITVLACFMGGVDPFGGFGRVGSVVLALFILQTLSSGLNLIGANQHLSTAVWGLALLAVMVLRWTAANISIRTPRKTNK